MDAGDRRQDALWSARAPGPGISEDGAGADVGGSPELVEYCAGVAPMVPRGQRWLLFVLAATGFNALLFATSEDLPISGRVVVVLVLAFCVLTYAGLYIYGRRTLLRVAAGGLTWRSVRTTHVRWHELDRVDVGAPFRLWLVFRDGGEHRAVPDTVIDGLDRFAVAEERRELIAALERFGSAAGVEVRRVGVWREGG